MTGKPKKTTAEVNVPMGPVLYEGWFSFRVPSDWEVEEPEDGLIAIHGDVGSVYVSCFERSSKEPPSAAEAKEMALRYAEDQGFEVTAAGVQPSTVDGGPCATFEAVDDEKNQGHWQVWTLLDATRAVLITYVCAVKAANKERAARQAMVAAFAWEPLDPSVDPEEGE